MAVVGEELGFFGMTLIMVLFAMLFMRCYKIIMGQSDLRDRFSAFGVTLVLAIVLRSIWPWLWEWHRPRGWLCRF